MTKPINIEYCYGDILQSDAFVIVNPVNCVGVMGKGLALQFKKKYPAMFRHYRAYCNNGFLKPGGYYDYRIPNPTNNTYYIYNFATKDHWSQPSQMPWIVDGLASLQSRLYWHYLPRFRYEKVVNDNHTLPKKMYVAIPALGCGEGRLQYDEVEDYIIKKLCNNYQEQIQVVIYPPK